MTDITQEVEVKTTTRLALYGPFLNNDVDDDFGGGCEDYGHIQLQGQRLVNEQWFQGIVEEVRQSRQHKVAKASPVLDNLKTGIDSLDGLLKAVFLAGQGERPTPEMLEYLEDIKKRLAKK